MRLNIGAHTAMPVSGRLVTRWRLPDDFEATKSPRAHMQPHTCGSCCRYHTASVESALKA